MASENALPNSTLPIKVTEPDLTAPPTLAEPASGPVAEMPGALTGGASEDQAEAEGPKTEINGAPESAPNAPSNDSNDTPAQPSATAELTTEPAQKTAATPGAKDEDTLQEKSDEPASEVKPDDAPADANGEADSKISSKRKSSAGVSEPKGKKLNKKKSLAKITHLDAKPGDYFFARLRSYPPWPAIICNEVMLPSSLLNTRPVTAAKDDGTYNEPYADGGKKVNERTFPIMFLHTNEFAWIPNTDLGDLDPQQCQEVAEKGKSKSLLAAYEVAAQNHDLAFFENMLLEHAKAMEEDEIERQKAAEAKANKSKDKKKRKSDAKAKPADPDEDVEMEDAEESAETKKSSKKRKKVAESDDDEAEKPAKTPKTTKLKLTTNKTPATSEKKQKEKPTKAKSDKGKSKAAAEDEDEAMPDAPEEEEPPKPMDPADAKKAREKEVLFLRHRLQKGFLSRDQAPQEEDMPQMAQYVKKLEGYEDLEVTIIRTTKINKVLKALVKLNTIPRDEEFAFRKRSVDLLGKWNKALGAEPQDGDAAADEKETAKSTPATNGVHEDSVEEKKEEPKEEPAATQAPTAEPAQEATAAAPAENKTDAAPQPEAEGAKTVEPATDAPKTEVADVSANAGMESAKVQDSAQGTTVTNEAIPATE